MRQSPRGFSRLRRLLKGREFDAVFADSRRSSDRYFAVLYRPGSTPAARLGFAIARQRIKLATARNRLRRIVRESFRHQRLPPVDIVVLARDDAGTATNQELLASLTRHWARIVETTVA
jgi:ribonuclease P protein component